MTNKTQARLLALMGGASMLALGAAPAAAQNAAEAYVAKLESRGAYLTGDKHNHTTCTDGTTSVRTLVDRVTLVYDLDWFAQTGHGGSGNRDCRFDDVQSGNYFKNTRNANTGLLPFPTLEEDALVTDLARSNSRQLWVDTIGREGIKGDRVGSAGAGGDRMWRWQSLIEYAYPDVANAGRISNSATWLGLETNTPGHEHTSMGIIGKQFARAGDGYAIGQFEYLWDRADNDFSGGGAYDFENPKNRGVKKIPNVAGDHNKAVASVAWLRKNYPADSYYVVAHVERQGGYITTGNNGTNIEHLRDYHNAGLFRAGDVTSPSVAFGFESDAGHQFQSNRGGYSISTPAVGWGTYGGAGAYTGAETSQAGFDFDGTPLTAARLAELKTELDDKFSGPNTYPGVNTSRPTVRYILGRPGIRTAWDAMLGEGRSFFFFSSSDWHNRGAFGPFEPHSTNDPWPGEYNKIYAFTNGGDGGYSLATARGAVAGMRSGNTWSVRGDLIDAFYFVMCQGAKCATMGETLKVNPAGVDVTYMVKLRDPAGTNRSPYAFSNPSLLQVGLEIPVNRPVLDNVDIIRGDVTGKILPSDPAYRTNVSNPTTEIFATMMRDDFTVDGDFMVKSGSIPAASFDSDMYFRVRGTNMPKGTPNETDADGNPLLDYHTNNIPCPFPYVDPNAATPLAEFNPMSCPQYLPVNPKLEGAPQVSDYDVEAWSDLWFYANPIFIDVPATTQADAARATRG